MNIIYAKTLLHAYPNIESITEQIDELVERKALSSMNDFSSCISQCEKILGLTAQKDVYINLKIILDGLMGRFTAEEIDLLDYKYFKKKPKDYYINFDSQSRGYFRRQIKVVNKFSDLLERKGITEKWYEENCLPIEFFRELLKRVKENEVLSRKNPSREEKLRRQTPAKFSGKTGAKSERVNTQSVLARGEGVRTYS